LGDAAILRSDDTSGFWVDFMQMRIEQPTRCGWSDHELRQLLARIGSCISSERYRTEYGVTNDGDAWFAVNDTQRDDVLLQISRIDGEYAVALDAYRKLSFADTIDSAIDAALHFLTALAAEPTGRVHS
jgi:hypothetical protein